MVTSGVEDVAAGTGAARRVAMNFARHPLAYRLPRMGAAVAGGLLLCASFPPVGWWPAAIAGLALLGWALAHQFTTLAGGFGYGLLFGLSFYLPLLPWTGGFVGVVPWLALSLVCAVFPALFAVPAVAVRNLRGWPLWWAAWWVVLEWLKSVVPFGGFPWGAVGFGQADGPLAAFARLGGVALVSFVTALAGFCLTATAKAIWPRAGADAKRDGVVAALCVALVAIGTAGLWPLVRQSATAGERTLTVAAVQGNVPRLGLDFNAQRRAVLDNHVDQTVRLSNDVNAGRVAQPQVVIWPENSSDIDPIDNDDAARQITVAAKAIRAPILVGTVLARPESTPSTPASSNTVIVWDPATGPGQRHDKKIIQPFGEYLPWRSFFRHFSAYADRAGYFMPGNGTGIVSAAGVPIGVTTCWEVIFDRAAREAVRNGAQLLAIPTNNATFNESMSRQQLAFAKIRAIEHDRTVIVAGTTGISAVITPDGRDVASTEFFESAYLLNTVTLKTGLSPATRWGPYMQWTLSVIAAAALIVALLPGRATRPQQRSTHGRVDV